MKWICSLALLVLLPAGTLAAQEPPTLAPGTRVRVTTISQTVVGTIESLDSALIVVRRPNRELVTFPTQYLRVDVSAGPGFCAGMRSTCIVIGLVGGAAVGFGVPALIISMNENAGELDGLIVVVTVPLGALVGTVVGATVGGERWKRVDLSAVLSPAPGGPGGPQPIRTFRAGVRFTF